ncbi:UrcA family protein [Rhizorhabdus sp.]|uniref:UrcA family protein n=1 Tax=Rhizorhabdus sp. TaxID=1968843 RepID=UPI0019BFA069|nr:UrcA family protein [Rhizorhabdus sp.]MBD3761459.1 UrcA family protein [Rhizorhabdus sp.]
MKKRLPPNALWLIAGAALITISVPSPLLAQSAEEELVVTGQYGTMPDSVKSLSQAVSYHDLDLSTGSGRAEIRHRIKLTSRYLCEKLGESGSSSGVVPSCEQAATTDAMKRIGTIEESFSPRGTTWVAGPAWAPPYPADWAKRY